jgi:hypothetical protein
LNGTVVCRIETDIGAGGTKEGSSNMSKKEEGMSAVKTCTCSWSPKSVQIT